MPYCNTFEVHNLMSLLYALCTVPFGNGFSRGSGLTGFAGFVSGRHFPALDFELIL